MRWKQLKNKITFGTTTRHFLVANAFQILIISPLSRGKKTCARIFKFIFIAIAIEEFVLFSILLVASCIHYYSCCSPQLFDSKIPQKLNAIRQSHAPETKAKINSIRSSCGCHLCIVRWLPYGSCLHSQTMKSASWSDGNTYPAP